MKDFRALCTNCNWKGDLDDCSQAYNEEEGGFKPYLVDVCPGCGKGGYVEVVKDDSLPT